MANQATPNSNALPYTLVVTASGKGGSGKTTFLANVNDVLKLADFSPTILQLDDQERIGRMIKRDVITLDTNALKRARRDPGILTKVFEPLWDTLVMLGQGQGPALLDIGATRLGDFLAYTDLVELTEEIQDLAIRIVVFVLVVSEPEAISQAVSAISRIQKSLPSAELILVENERDGRLCDLSAHSAAGHLRDESLNPIAALLPRIVLPLCEGRSWSLFERAYLSPLDVILMDKHEAAEVTGLDLPSAKISRGDVAAWFARVEEQLHPILGIGD